MLVAHSAIEASWYELITVDEVEYLRSVNAYGGWCEGFLV